MNAKYTLTAIETIGFVGLVAYLWPMAGEISKTDVLHIWKRVLLDILE